MVRSKTSLPAHKVGPARNFIPLKTQFDRPAQLIGPTQSSGSTEYQLDAYDIEWLWRFNAENPTISMSPDELEALLDRLEKDSTEHLRTHRQVAPTE